MFTKSVLAAAALLGAVFALDGGAAAQTFPTKPVRIIVPSTPGGGLDILTRLVAQKMEKSLGQSVIVENRAGADTLIGTRVVKELPADGYTLLAQGDGITLFPYIKADAGYELKDFTGIGIMSRLPFLMVVAGASPDRTVNDYIARAKKANLTYASGGVGTPPHVAFILFLKAAGVNITHVPYKGNGAALPDVATDRVSMIFDTFSSSAPYLKGGKLKALAVTGPSRIAPLPDVPTFKEQNVDYSYTFWLGLLARQETPPTVRQRLSEAVRDALSSPDLIERLRSEGSDPTYVQVEEFNAFLAAQSAQMRKVAGELEIPKE